MAALIQTSALACGAVLAVEIDGIQAVAFRTVDGTVCVTQRYCPHLDWDLAEASVEGSELVCPGHGWSIGCDGSVFKRNEFGRIDEKGRATVWQVVEDQGMIHAGESR